MDNRSGLFAKGKGKKLKFLILKLSSRSLMERFKISFTSGKCTCVLVELIYNCTLLSLVDKYV